MLVLVDRLRDNSVQTRGWGQPRGVCVAVAVSVRCVRVVAVPFDELCVHVLALLDDVVVVQQVLQLYVLPLEDLIQTRRRRGAEASAERSPEAALKHRGGGEDDSATTRTRRAERRRREGRGWGSGQRSGFQHRRWMMEEGRARWRRGEVDGCCQGPSTGGGGRQRKGGHRQREERRAEPELPALRRTHGWAAEAINADTPHADHS